MNKILDLKCHKRGVLRERNLRLEQNLNKNFEEKICPNLMF